MASTRIRKAAPSAPGAAKVGDSAKVALLASASASAVVAAFVQGSEEIAQAETALGGARKSQLSRVLGSLEGVEPVNETLWADHWAKPVQAALVAAGYQDLPARSMTSQLKVVVIAHTNGIAPATETYATKVRDFYQATKATCAKRGLLTASKEPTAEQKKAAEAKRATKALAAAADKARALGLNVQGSTGSSKTATPDLLDDMQAALHLCGDGEDETAKALVYVTGDDDLYEAFKVALAALIPSKGRKRR